MKHFLVIALLFLTQIQLLAQKFIDGPANIRDKENGVAFLSLNNDVFVETQETSNDWFWISFIGNIPKTAVVNGMIVKGTELFDSEQHVVGKILVDKKINTDFTEQSKLNGFLKTQIWGYTYKSNLKDLSFAEILAKKNIQFADSSKSSIVIFEDNGGQQKLSQETEYMVVDALMSNEYIPIAIKTVKRKFDVFNKEQNDSRITMTFYPKLEKTKSFSIEKRSDECILQDNMLVAKTYGCCGADDVFELSTFPDNKTFLTCNTSYYRIEVPNTKHEIYVGFDIKPRSEDPTGTTIGVLNYALNQSRIGRVVFVAKDKSVSDNIVNFTPEIELVSESPKDVVRPGYYGPTLTAFSLSGVSDTNKLSGVGVKITFINESNNSKREYKVLLKNGDFEQKKITIDF